MRELTRRNFLGLLAGAPLVASAALQKEPLIDWQNRCQTIDGFGVSGAFHDANDIRLLEPGVRGEILDLLFSRERGAGLTMVRNVIGDGGTWGTPRNGPISTVEPREGMWNWSGDDGQLWFMREAVRRGCMRHFSTVWSPPAWMKDNGTVVGGGHLRPEKYRAFAEYLSAYIRGYRQHHDIDIHAISPANEPGARQKYSSCLWTGEELQRLVRDHIAPVFARDRIAAKLVLGESEHWSEAPALASLADPAAADRVDVVASHAYTKQNRGFEPISLRSGNLPRARAAGKPIWQTEVAAFDANDPGIEDGLYWARLLHTHVVENEVAAWFYWWAVAFHSSRSALIEWDDRGHRLIAAKRLYTLGNFSRFVRPGYRRVRCVPHPSPGVSLAAFVDPMSDERVVVAINENATAFDLDFPALRPVTACYRTSATENLRRVHGTGWLQPKSVATFVM